MNLLLLLGGFRVWSGSPLEVLTRALCAMSLFGLEMQLATWSGVATLTTLVPFNAAGAVALFVGVRHQAGRRPAMTDRDMAGARVWLPFAAVGLLVLALNATMPLEAADPYHLERVARIQQTGTLAYDAGAHPKVNVLGWLYELALADLRTLPAAGVDAARFHGVIGLIVYAVTSAAVFQVLGVPFAATGALMAVVPVVFHQLVMVKNDLFGGIPALLVLAWAVARHGEARPLDSAWAGWLAGLAVGVKLTSFPLGAIFAGAVAAQRGALVRRVASAAAGLCVGFVAAGLFFVLLENVAVYGDAVAPFTALGNRTAGPLDALVSVCRFAISLVDMGLVTRALWAGRGGWGGTYGLPVIWALCVLVAARRTPLAQRTLLVCIAYWTAFSAVYPDADVAHRLALAPGLLAVAVAAALTDAQGSPVPAWLRRLALPVGILSAVQIVRTAILYFDRA
jgi:hypothetical protein